MPLICAFPAKLRNLFASYLQFRFHQIAPKLQKRSLFSRIIWNVQTVKWALFKPRKKGVKNDNLLLRGNPALIALHRVKGHAKARNHAIFPGGLQAGGGQRAIAEDTRQGCGFPQSDSRGQSVDACRGCLEARFTNGSGCFSIHRRIGSHLMAAETGERDVARLTATTGHEAPGNPLTDGTDLWLASAPNQRKRECGLCNQVCLSRFSGGQGSRRLLKCVVGSHQASFLPSEEESFGLHLLKDLRTRRNLPLIGEDSGTVFLFFSYVTLLWIIKRPC